MDVVETRTEVKVVHRAQKLQPVIDEQLYLVIKRMLDIVIPLFSLLLLLPFYTIIALAILIENPRGKIIFRQTHLGKDGMQVCGRNNLGFEEMIEMDLQYIAWRNLGMDLRIIGTTLVTLLVRSGY